MKKIIITLIYLAIFMGSAVAQNDYFIQAIDSAKKYISDNHLKEQHNSYVDKNNVIHIFLYEDGNLLVKGFPTTATEKNRFQLHLFVKSSSTDHFRLEYNGEYSPALNITNGSDTLRDAFIKIDRKDFAVLGPFTNVLTLTLKVKTEASADYTAVPPTPVDIKIAKTIYASIGSAFIYTSLKNPTDPKTTVLPNGDTSLLANDNNGRGMLTIMATFYPWGRNTLLLPDWSFHDRFGILVGTSILSNTAAFENFYFGGSYDFSVAGSIIAGVHYGRRQEIAGVDYKTFNFGKTRFTGNLDEKKYFAWDFGFFVGVQVDSRIFSQLFPK